MNLRTKYTEWHWNVYLGVLQLYEIETPGKGIAIADVKVIAGLKPKNPPEGIITGDWKEGTIDLNDF